MNDRITQLIIFISLLNLVISNLKLNQTKNIDDNKISISTKVNQETKIPYISNIFKENSKTNMDLIFDIGSNYNIFPTNNFRKNCNLEKKEMAVSDLNISTVCSENIFYKHKQEYLIPINDLYFIPSNIEENLNGEKIQKNYMNNNLIGFSKKIPKEYNFLLKFQNHFKLTEESFMLEYIKTSNSIETKIIIGNLSEIFLKQNYSWNEIKLTEIPGKEYKWSSFINNIFFGNIFEDFKTDKGYNSIKLNKPHINIPNMNIIFESIYNKIIIPDKFRKDFIYNIKRIKNHQCKEECDEISCKIICSEKDIHFFPIIHFIISNNIDIYFKNYDLFFFDFFQNKYISLIEFSKEVNYFIFGIPFFQKYKAYFNRNKNIMLINSKSNNQLVSFIPEQSTCSYVNYGNEIFSKCNFLIENNNKFKDNYFDISLLNKYSFIFSQSTKQESEKIFLGNKNEKKKSEIKLSIIIATYNRKKQIKALCESIKKQSFKNFEVIIIDDDSSKDTKQELLNIQKKDKRFKIFFKKHTGFPSEGRNYGIDLSKGEYIYFSDDDDLLTNSFSKIFEKCVSTNYPICQFGANYLDSKNRKIIGVAATEGVFKNNQLGKIHKWNVIWNKIFKKSILKNVKFYDISREDSYFMIEIFDKLPTVFCMKDIGYNHFIKNEKSLWQIQNKDPKRKKKEKQFVEEVFTVNANLKTNIAKELLRNMEYYV